MSEQQETVEAYKVFNSDWMCRGFQYEVGKTYHHDGEIGLCDAGFHACKKLNHCFGYYQFNPKNKVAIVTLSGQIKHGDDKSVASTITIDRELTWHEVLELANLGYRNTGHSNTGDRNTGDRNTGFFCTETAVPTFFDKPTDLTWNEARDLIPWVSLPVYAEWVHERNMTDAEKEEYPSYKTTGGYLKSNQMPINEAFPIAWKSMDNERRERFINLPNFDAKKFEQITGVDVAQK